ncbi:Fic family protein [Rickettsia bellii]|uniref:Fic family protein n=2 Tax=Rickettsia bellii TaxID=33990 RepID=Q1RJC3_RICBR|nr:Fic family protein [Rickettsia bellii]ABE04541.1 Fic family protein [Rickettsia bellii RML369-C]ABV79405.1 Fic family protein [Rickettsia bellii OSU 85-389]KJV92118.1 RPE5 domain protein [Rickettsia bellii str. RML Mogi]
MQINLKFKPNYKITPKVVKSLMRIEAIKAEILHLPLNPTVLSSLRETARLYTTHYSTMIEGNRLDADQIKNIVQHQEHFPGRERDEDEVKGYYAALTQVEKWVAQNVKITENIIQTLHALIMSNGKTNVKPTKCTADTSKVGSQISGEPAERIKIREQWRVPKFDLPNLEVSKVYRDGQNVIKDSGTKKIIYMPPEAKDVKNLMHNMVLWINNNELPFPVIAAIAHYQFATIHPYYDGNGRTARLLTTLILHLGGYDLKGLYSLEEYYAKNLGAYYEAISIGHHNYYMGRAEADITGWVEYFINGMAISFEKVLNQMQEVSNKELPDMSAVLRKLDPKQRKVLELFKQFEVVTSSQIGKVFGFKPRTSAKLCADWVDQGFLKIIDFSNKGRKYSLSDEYVSLITKTV